jgi:hypothetical protein
MVDDLARIFPNSQSRNPNDRLRRRAARSGATARNARICSVEKLLTPIARILPA